MNRLEIVEVGLGERLDAVYASVIEPSFSPMSLITLQSLRSGVKSGQMSVYAVLDLDTLPIAVAVGEWSARSRVQLLAYLAVRPGLRGHGHGGRLLAHAMAQWRKQYSPCAILAEIEDPATHPASDAYGDATARVRFYRSHGARALDLPYFQPALYPGWSRIYGMILIVLSAEGPLLGPAPQTLAAEPIREFLVEYLEGEGAVGDDPATARLLAAVGRPHGIATHALDERA